MGDGMNANAADDDLETVEAAGELDAHSLEALRLEVRRLARKHGVDVPEVRVEKLEKPAG
jgi:hypothetical protein